MALKDLLGTIKMEPVEGECVIENGQLIQNRAYYVAHNNIDTLTLLEESKGSNAFQRRTRSQRIRTFSLIHIQIKIPCHQALAIYQALAPRIKELKALELSNDDIATRLKIHKKTVIKGLLYKPNTSFL